MLHASRRRRAWLIGLPLVLITAVVAGFSATGLPRLAAGMAAKAVCSAVFVAGRAPDGLLDDDVRPASAILRPVSVAIDRRRRAVTAAYVGLAERRAVWLPDRGCVLDREPGAGASSAADAPAPYDASAVWPAGDGAVPRDAWGSDVNGAALQSAVDRALVGAGDPYGANTRGVAVVYQGRLLVLRHAPGFGPGTALHGWSMTKTIGGMLLFKLAGETGLPLDRPVVDAFLPGREPAWVATWRRDERRRIRVSDLLYMRDGLGTVENYDPWGTVPRMLWTRDDAAEVGAASAPEAPAGTRWRYLSATANILAAVARGRFTSDAAYWAYPRTALFEPVGARTAVMETDPSGNWIASSFGWASTADWARLGELLRLDGRWNGARVLPPGFLLMAQAPALPEGPGLGYGAATWRIGEPSFGTCKDAGLPTDTISMAGHWGQIVAVVPSRSAVVVRLGWTFDKAQYDTCAFVADVLRALPQ